MTDDNLTNPLPGDAPTINRFITAFRRLAQQDPGSPFTPGWLDAANVLERCLPVDPMPPVARKYRFDVGELLGR